MVELRCKLEGLNKTVITNCVLLVCTFGVYVMSQHYILNCVEQFTRMSEIDCVDLRSPFSQCCENTDPVKTDVFSRTDDIDPVKTDFDLEFSDRF